MNVCRQCLRTDRQVVLNPTVRGHRFCGSSCVERFVTDNEVSEAEFVYKCNACKSENLPIGLYLCGRCKNAYYCNRSCQRSHWRDHKRECTAPVEPFELRSDVLLVGDYLQLDPVQSNMSVKKDALSVFYSWERDMNLPLKTTLDKIRIMKENKFSADSTEHDYVWRRIYKDLMEYYASDSCEYKLAYSRANDEYSFVSAEDQEHEHSIVSWLTNEEQFTSFYIEIRSLMRDTLREYLELRNVEYGSCNRPEKHISHDEFVENGFQWTAIVNRRTNGRMKNALIFGWMKYSIDWQKKRNMMSINPWLAEQVTSIDLALKPKDFLRDACKNITNQHDFSDKRIAVHLSPPDWMIA